MFGGWSIQPAIVGISYPVSKIRYNLIFPEISVPTAWTPAPPAWSAGVVGGLRHPSMISVYLVSKTKDTVFSRKDTCQPPTAVPFPGSPAPTRKYTVKTLAWYSQGLGILQVGAGGPIRGLCGALYGALGALGAP